MDFFKTVARDIVIYTIPFMAVRLVLCPIANINAKMQRQYRKVEEEADIKDKYQKYQNFTLQEKFNFVKDLTKVGGIKSKKSFFLQALIKLGVYEKCENYLVPFLIARIAEGIVYFTFMRYCMDILKLEDPLYLLTGLAFFFVSLVGSFCLKFFGDVMRERKGLKAALAHLSPSNRTFWKQYEVELGYYHAYSLIQGYFMLFTFWYFKPSMTLEVILFGLSKYLGTVTCQPLAILSQWSQEHDYDHVKLLQHVAKRDGKLGLFAGAKDMILNEVLFAIILIPGSHLLSAMI